MLGCGNESLHSTQSDFLRLAWADTTGERRGPCSTLGAGEPEVFKSYGANLWRGAGKDLPVFDLDLGVPCDAVHLVGGCDI